MKERNVKKVTNNKKAGVLRLCMILVLIISLTGCSLFSQGPKAPSGNSENSRKTESSDIGTSSGGSSSDTSGYTGTIASYPATFNLSKAGVSFDLPSVMQGLTGTIQQNYGVEVDPGSGLYLSGLTYCAMSAEKYAELVKKGTLSEEDMDFIRARMLDFILVYTLSGNRTMTDLTDLLNKYGLPADDVKEVGAVGEYSFYYVVNPMADTLDTDYTFDGSFREEYDKLVLMADDPSWIRIYEPAGTVMAAEGDVITFETVDLEGNAISSGDIFASHTLTMINLWGTYCGPCINEMPDLEELSHRLEEKNCAIIGVVIDVYGPEDSTMIGTAKDILSSTGVTYLNLLPWSGIFNQLPAEFIPTTYFIDSNGQVVGEAAVGARGADDYEALIDDILSDLQ